MELLTSLIDLFLNLDQHLDAFIAEYGTWTYLILFLVIFCETGLVVTPILPGDSLLFAAGAIAARGGLEIPWLIGLLTIAAIAGDALNYSIGRYLGPKVLTGKSRFLKREYLERTHGFFERYGGKTIIIARFVPIVRTFAPFVAGVGSMSYPKFAAFNCVGGVAWIAICVVAGYLFGNLPLVKEYFELVVLAIVLISVMPMVFEIWRARRLRTSGPS